MATEISDEPWREATAFSEVAELNYQVRQEQNGFCKMTSNHHVGHQEWLHLSKGLSTPLELKDNLYY